MKKGLLLTLCLLLVFSFAACKKKEEQPVPQIPGPIMPEQMPQMPPQMPPGQMPPGPVTQPGGTQQMAKPGMMPRGKTQVTVPDAVKGSWQGAKIVLEDKGSKTKQEYAVKLNSDFAVPSTTLKIHVGDFLPDFKMDGLTLTSSSNQPNNPALGIRVYENGKQIFPAAGRQWGWLFSKVPSIHPFEHPKYGITLKEG
ncbi:MAG: hypothetical protein AB1442_17960, partial [Nitrospirota bacterium]